MTKKKTQSDPGENNLGKRTQPNGVGKRQGSSWDKTKGATPPSGHPQREPPEL